RTLQHRGGGVIRFRPDGSGLELFATGTRNILGTPVSPLLDIFARDNTNDGGGWDVRFHHFSGLEDHGYPRLYKNFADEHVHPLADYGGGSGCGSVYIHEPGFPDQWNKSPFTCDWGKAGLFRHSVQRVGASFEEVTAPQNFIKVSRPTDADVDGMSAVYQASWRGPATFKWAGAEHGYIARVTPKGYTPEPLPDFEKLSDIELVTALESPSHVRTLAAQRALLRREANEDMTDALLKLAENAEKPLEARVAALFTLTQRGTKPETADAVLDQIAKFNKDPDLVAYTMRAMGDLPIKNFPTGLLNFGMASEIAMENPRSRAEAAIAAARLDAPGAGPQISALLRDEDPRVRHVAFQALAKTGDFKACLPILDDEIGGKYAAFALMRMHKPEVVDALLSRLESEENALARRNVIMALARLAQREAEWKGDSWGTRPDTRGPYYQLTIWSETDKILAALKSTLESTTPEEAAFIVQEMGSNRIQSNDALNSILSLAAKNPKLVPDAVKQLAAADSIPTEGIQILLRVAKSDGQEFGYDAIADAVTLLAKTDEKSALEVSLAALGTLQGAIGKAEERLTETQKIEDPVKKKSEGKYAKQAITDANKRVENASRGFLKSPKLENHHLALETIAHEKPGTPEGFWATAGVLELASRKNGSPESRDLSQKAVDTAWQNPKQQAVLIEAVAFTKNRLLDDRIQIALTSPDPTVQAAAKAAAKALKIQPKGADKTPKIGTLDPKDAIAAAIKHKGDVALGESVYARATCVACHTVSQDQPQKGPYLGNIIETYKRPELAEAIIDPNKTIAQGFKTNLFTLKNGTTQMGFVTNEQGEQVTVRDIAAQEHTFKKSDIAKRDTLPNSLMPPALMNNFTVHEMASLLDYLEAVGKNGK
ncbi:MAG: c-type cytochrome, partial [Verrucomicrobiales bacterium]|nr:c-type cytochrome [Verrucomicrobiales bacterium]